MMTGTKFDIKKFNGKNDFGLWKVRMKALLEQHGLAVALEKLLAATTVGEVVPLLSENHHRERTGAPNMAPYGGVTELKGDGGRGLYVRGRSGQRDIEQGTDSAWSKSHGRSNMHRKEDQVSGSRVDEYDSADVMMVMSVEEPLDWIMDSRGSYHMTYKRDYLFDFEEYDGGNILLGDGME
uniref:Zinc finger, CCHC-type n=1 Tax=Tanacetum cinerariifolium TaxID=118510 RepID=A0A6L2LB38_TANCI|nr:hypothetical protein [Tanacetum cinerariifolium]